MSNLEVNPAAQRSMDGSDLNPPVLRPEHAEGNVSRLIEQQSAKLPSHLFLFLALGAMTTSLVLELAGQRNASRFVGQWPTPLLVMGIYNKMVKTLGTR